MLPETIKSLSDEIIRYISSGGFFYEYGVHRSLMVIIIYCTLAIIIYCINNNNNYKNLKINNFKIDLFILIASVFFVFVYFNNIKIMDYQYFYPPSTKKRLENIEFLAILYGITMVMYFRLCELIIKKNPIVKFISMLFIITSPLQLWVLFSSSSRDFTRAIIVTSLLLLIINIIYNKIKLSNTSLLYCSALLMFSITFRQDIVIYIPLLVLAIFMFYEDAVKQKIYIVIKLILLLLPGYIFISTGIINTFNRASERFIPGLSEDIIRLHHGEPNGYIGPFDDQITTIVMESYGNNNSNRTETIFNFLINYDFIYEYVSRFKVIAFDTYMLPKISNIYPNFFRETILGTVLENMRQFLDIEILYYIAIIFLFWNIRKKFKLFIYILFSIVYLTSFNGLQFLHKNIFHFEFISYLILFFGCYNAFRAIMNINFFCNSKA